MPLGYLCADLHLTGTGIRRKVLLFFSYIPLDHIHHPVISYSLILQKQQNPDIILLSATGSFHIQPPLQKLHGQQPIQTQMPCAVRFPESGLPAIQKPTHIPDGLSQSPEA